MKNIFTFFWLFLGLSTLATAQWSYTENTIARWYHGSAIVEGKLILAGGLVNGLATISSVEIYDIASDTWSASSLSQARGFIGATVQGSKAYFAGGGNFSGLVSDKIDVYDANTQEWSLMNMEEARSGIAAVTVGNKVIFAGGGRFNYPTYTPSDLVEIYDVVSEQWEYATLSEPRMFMGAGVAGNKAFFAGGVNSSTSASNVVDIYDAETGTWETTTLSQARSEFSVVALGNKVLFVGGTDPLTNDYDIIDIYNLSEGSWETATFPQEVSWMGAATIGNRAYFAGGSKVDDDFYVEDPYNTLHIYDASEDGWSVDYMQQPRVAATANVWENKVYIAGGFNWNIGLVNLVEIYTDSTVFTNIPAAGSPKEILLFPNPARETLSVQWASEGQSVSISIFNALGQEVKRMNSVRALSFPIDLSQLQPGVYYLILEQKGQRLMTNKFMVER